MLTNSKSLAIFTLFAVFWLENKAHHCGFPHEKTHKKTEKAKTSTTTPAPKSTSTPAKLIKVNYKCNTGTVPSCQCINSDGSYYYPVPKSGNCKDVFKRLSTTPSNIHFREENCSKVQRTVCRIDYRCDDFTFGEIRTPPPTPDEFVIGQNTSKPFCKCYYDANHYPIPKNGNCTDLETTMSTTQTMSDNQRSKLFCYKTQAFCRNTCRCNNYYVDPTECDPQTCNNVSEPFCKCGIDDVHYPVPESGDCLDVIKQFSTTEGYQYRFGYTCDKARSVCSCKYGNNCRCEEECESTCSHYPHVKF